MSFAHRAHQSHVVLHVLKHMWDSLPPLSRKNPLLAAFLGFWFGGPGLGLYFRSWKDCAFPILAFALITLLFGTVIPLVGAAPGAFFACLFNSAWGLVRALDSGRAPDQQRGPGHGYHVASATSGHIVRAPGAHLSR